MTTPPPSANTLDLRPLMFETFVCTLAVMSFVALVGPLARKLGLAPWQAGAAVTVGGIAWMLAARPWGIASDRHGRRRILLGGLAGFALSYGSLCLFIVLALHWTLPTLLAFAGIVLLRGLALLLGGAPLVWWGWRAQVWRDGFGADYLTAVGERRDLVLEDGSQVEMNTDSALDVRYDAGQRLLRLYRGEIYLRTAADRREPPRPFLVRTEQGLMRALGTAFSVRREGAETVLAVYEGAVQVRPEGAASAADGRVIEAGQRVRFDRQRIGPVESASEAALAWRQGLLVADDMPLRQWAGELMRYGGESIECEPSLDPLRVSGTFPVDDLPLALAMLAQTHGLRLVHQGRRVLIRR